MKLIQFPQTAQDSPPPETAGSAAYRNLKELFSLTESVDVVDFYLDTVEQLIAKGKIRPDEYRSLRETGISRRQTLEVQSVRPVPSNGPGCYPYCPEMGQAKPVETEITARRSYWNGHYSLTTMLNLKGRGITRDDFPESADGTKGYTVTERAFEKLKERYVIALEFLLD